MTFNCLKFLYLNICNALRLTNIVKEDVICRTHAVPTSICSWLKRTSMKWGILDNTWYYFICHCTCSWTIAFYWVKSQLNKHLNLKVQLFDRQNLVLMILEILHNLAAFIDPKAFFSGCMCGYGIYTTILYRRLFH